ncbi:SLIT and NTRK-like protein 5 [Engraulis encrasicolus]|uniref:SLIT and NTRK-like protein 5 n=1 Tax=Engraulis encrasicolus TaxID=184585 RepID=UPI002FD13455
MHIWISTTLLAVTSLSFVEMLDRYGEVCRELCDCEEKDGSLGVSCENRGITSLAEIEPVHYSTYNLLLTGNLLKKLSLNDFVQYEGAIILHLGNNDISEIEAGAFNGLQGLKRLHLNNNKIDSLREDMFIGLELLEYLQLDYNYISHVDASAFSKLRHLEVLILNDNLLSALPPNVFQYVPLTHLDLRGNQLKLLPYHGLLEHMNKIVELQLEENPWNCSCELIPLKAWLESISYTALVGDVVCETPFRLHGRDLGEVSKQELCPRRAIAEYEMHAEPARSSEAYVQTTPASVAASVTSAGGTLRSSRPTKGSRQSGKLRSKPTQRPSPNKQNYGPMVSYQTKSPVPLDCPASCNCNLQISDLGLNVNCQERKIESIADLDPKPYNPKKMYLTGNYIPAVHRSDFADATGLDLLHLGNNRISTIHDSAFRDLANLRRLYLNGNLIERLTDDMFYGLESLQFLYLEYNVIREIAPATFEQVPNLQLLFLNNNLLKTLPEGVFNGLTLARLNLRNNHLRNLLVGGVLDQLRSLVQIDLYENPWDCSCSVVEMKLWLEQLASGTVVNSVVCESPMRLSGEDMRFIHASHLCPNTSSGGGGGGGLPGSGSASAAPPSEESLPGSTISLESSLDYDSSYSPVPLSVLILALLMIFIMSVFILAGLFAVVRRRRKKTQNERAPSISADLSAFNSLYSSGRSTAKVKSSAGQLYEYIPPPGNQPAKNPTFPINENSIVERFRDFDDLNGAFTPNSDDELASNARSSEYSECTGDALKPSPMQEDNFFYRDILARDNKQVPYRGSSKQHCKHGGGHSSSHYSQDYDVRPQFLHPDSRAQQTMVYCTTTPATVYVEPNRSEYWELKAKLHFEPDYLEVHEKRTTFTQF